MSDDINYSSFNLDRLLSLIESSPAAAADLVRRRMGVAERKKAKSFCVGCAEVFYDTDYWYMVKDSTWEEAKLTEGFMHIECLSTQLGRKLTKDDFTEYPINNIINAMFECCEM